MVFIFPAVTTIYIPWMMVLGLFYLQNGRNSGVSAFLHVPRNPAAKDGRVISTKTTTTTTISRFGVQNQDGDATTTEQKLLDTPDLVRAASKFKIVTCMSTSCCRRRKNLGLDSLATFSDLYTLSSKATARSSTGSAEPIIMVEEGPCLGACKMAPCVAIEHEDFVGSVALEGMTDREFMDRV